MIAACVIMLGAIASGQIDLRGGQPVAAPIVDISPDGVQVGGDEPRTIPWDSVRAVGGEWAPDAERYKGVSDTAWRARVRLARGDAPLALPLFEELFPRYRDRHSALSLMIAEGLYQCRYRSGDVPGAFEAWLVAASLRAEGLEIAGDPPLKPLLDPDSHLPRELAPIFIDGPDARRIAAIAESALSNTSQGLSDQVRPVVMAYRRAALRAMGNSSPDDPAGPVPESAELPVMIADAFSPDPSRRSAAREALQPYLAPSFEGTWREAWARAAIGRSLLLDNTKDGRISGVLQLLHLPARFADSQPYLCAIALAEASEGLRAMNDEAAAAHLRQELLRLAPDHDAVAWLDAHRSAPPNHESPTPGDTN